MVFVQELSEKYNLEIIGDAQKKISGPTSLDEQAFDKITWVKAPKYAELVERGVVVLNRESFANKKENVTYLITDSNVKLIFSQILRDYFTPETNYYLVNTVEEHRKDSNITISDNVFIGQNVKIGKGTIIFPNVVIEANTTIGEYCVIKSHVSLGTEGLGLQLNEETNQLEKFPQLGRVVLMDNVEIGPTSTVRRGALKNTIIRKGTKIGSLVNIGHNCDIGENCILTCNIVTAGSSKIGNNAFIGINVVINNAIDIGSGSQIGMGAVVTKAIPDNVVAYGSPAKVVRKRDI